MSAMYEALAALRQYVSLTLLGVCIGMLLTYCVVMFECIAPRAFARFSAMGTYVCNATLSAAT